MTIFTTITLLERYLDVDEETKEFYHTLGLPFPKTYKYEERSYHIDDIDLIDDIRDEPKESLVVFVDGHKVVVLENPDELYIRINDLKNGIAFGEG